MARRGRPGQSWFWIGSLALASVLLVPVASADAAAFASPSVAAPGEPLTLTLRLNSTRAAEIAVDERVSCSYQAVLGTERLPCGPDKTATEVRLTPGDRDYTFIVNAPSIAGEYVVHLERATILGTVSPIERAEVRFLVVVPEPLTDARDPTDPPAPLMGPQPPDPALGVVAVQSLSLVAVAAGVAVRRPWK